MKKIIYYFFLLTLSISFSFCKTTQYTPTDYPKGQITFGKAGGFAALTSSKEFTILENGEVFSKKGMKDEYQTYTKIEKAKVTQLFKNIEVLQLKEVKLNKPGNRYFYITIKDKSGEHQLVWHNPESVPNKVKTFYDILNHLTKLDF